VSFSSKTNLKLLLLIKVALMIILQLPRAGLEGVQTAQPSWASPKDGPQKNKLYPVVYYSVVYYPPIKGVQTAHGF
jgi:hypothetical protein